MDKCPTCGGRGKVCTKEDVDKLAEAIMRAHAEYVKQDELLTGERDET